MAYITLPNAIICEIDGVLSDNHHRLHYIKNYCDAFKDPLPIPCGCHPNWNLDYEAYYAAMGDDKPNFWCWELLERISLHELEMEGYHTLEAIPIIFITWRPEKYRQETEKWISKFVFKDTNLFMRPDFLPFDVGNTQCFNSECNCDEREPDVRPSHIVKREIYEREIKGKYDVLFVLENDPDCVKMYRKLGLTVLDCGK